MKKWKKNIKEDMLPYLVLAGLMIVLFFSMKMRADDLFFAQVLEDKSLFGWLKERYQTWSSRTLVEAALALITQRGMKLWYVLQLILTVAWAWGMQQLGGITRKKDTWFAVVLILFFPFVDMQSAGWIATTLNYLWPWILGLLAYLPLQRTLHGIRGAFAYALGFVAFLYSSNVEQMCVFQVIVSTYFLIVMIKDKVKRKGYSIALCIAAWASLGYIVFCPGNQNRGVEEIPDWFADYKMLNLVDKIALGFEATMQELVFEKSWMFFLFALLLCMVVFEHYEKPIYRIVAAIPAAVSGLLGVGGELTDRFFPTLQYFTQKSDKNGMITRSTFTEWYRYLVVAFLAGVCLCVILSLYLAEQKLQQKYQNIWICFAGFASRMVMAVTPTIWVSGNRTFCFLNGALMLVSPRLFSQIMEENKRKYLKIGIITVSVLSFLNTQMQLVRALVE